MAKKVKLIDLPIPVDVVNRLTLAVTSQWPYMQPEDTRRMWERLLELYFFIQISQSRRRTELINKKASPLLIQKTDLWTAINRKEFQKFAIRIGNEVINYNVLLKILESAEVIEINHSYSTGKFSKGYRPHPEINRDQTMMLALGLLDRINRKFRWQTQEDLEYSWPKHYRLIATLFKTSIDIKASFDWLDSHRGQIWRYRDGQALYLDQDTIWEHKITAVMINLGLHWFTVDAPGRVHTNISNLPRTLVPFILINGQPTVEIDAINCQPLLLNRLINNQLYQVDCESGRFYEKIALELGCSRDEAKRIAFSKIFFNNRWLDPDLYDTLNNIWPGLPDQINSLKCRSPKEARSTPDIKMLWYRLQSIESEIFINSACQQRDPILTRHDSWIVIQTHHWWTRSELEASFRKLGLHAQLKITPEI